MYGHIVAGDPKNGLAFLIPAYKLFEDLERTYKCKPKFPNGGTWTLSSLFNDPLHQDLFGDLTLKEWVCYKLYWILKYLLDMQLNRNIESEEIHLTVYEVDSAMDMCVKHKTLWHERHLSEIPTVEILTNIKKCLRTKHTKWDHFVLRAFGKQKSVSTELESLWNDLRYQIDVIERAGDFHPKRALEISHDAPLVKPSVDNAPLVHTGIGDQPHAQASKPLPDIPRSVPNINLSTVLSNETQAESASQSTKSAAPYRSVPTAFYNRPPYELGGWDPTPKGRIGDAESGDESNEGVLSIPQKNKKQPHQWIHDKASDSKKPSFLPSRSDASATTRLSQIAVSRNHAEKWKLLSEQKESVDVKLDKHSGAASQGKASRYFAL